MLIRVLCCGSGDFPSTASNLEPPLLSEVASVCRVAVLTTTAYDGRKGAARASQDRVFAGTEKCTGQAVTT